jgi:rhombotail lipoprotein
MNSMARMIVVVVSCLALPWLGGCAGLDAFGRQQRNTSSMVDYLYPQKEVKEVPAIPRLSLPLRVGVAFVPESEARYRPKSNLTEKDKLELMERISAEFNKLDFVKEIEIIPSAYLTRGGGFTNLDQIRTMYAVDVIALLSYDQVQHTDEGLLSLSYWTIIGAYVVKGEKNDTSTMVDAAVYDIKSRKMLFRAPGTSHIKQSATLVNLSEQLRLDSLNGFRLAADDLVVNLQSALDRFKLKVKEKPAEYIVEHQAGYSGGASIDGLFAVVLLLLGGLALWREKVR